MCCESLLTWQVWKLSPLIDWLPVTTGIMDVSSSCRSSHAHETPPPPLRFLAVGIWRRLTGEAVLIRQDCPSGFKEVFECINAC